ncbi:MAG: helix-turn-helix domain-containing protein [Actinobacteria bacterium]|nr:helix-turn-helix domain-containing protein [Actinomycetota bacterium]
MAANTELGDAIRAWRERLSPSEAGLSEGEDRRVPGLRREEVALIAGISVDYLVRLEQGRSSHPSGQVLASLARALRLDHGERGLLYRAAGATPPPSGEVPREVPRSIRALIDRMADTPIAVFSAAWDMVECNAMWEALFGMSVEQDHSGPINLIWWHFGAGVDDQARPPAPVVRDPEETDSFERQIVSDLRRAADRYPDDRAVEELVDGLREANPRFAELWSRYEVAPCSQGLKTVLHPQLGPIDFEGDVLTVDGSDLRVVICTTVPGTPDGDAFDVLREAMQSAADWQAPSSAGLRLPHRQLDISMTRTRPLTGRPTSRPQMENSRGSFRRA